MEFRIKYLLKVVMLFFLFLSGFFYVGFINKINELILLLVGGEFVKVVWGDFNNDGYFDFLVGKMLYWNDVGIGFILVVMDFVVGIWGDYDNDGYLDIYFYI